MPDLDLTELTPLAKLIADTIADTPIRIGQRPDALVANLTLKVAAYMGKQVTGLPEQLAELQQLRAERDHPRAGDLCANCPHRRCDHDERIVGNPCTRPDLTGVPPTEFGPQCTCQHFVMVPRG